ncbi:zinc finger protein 773-like isoform X2 [Ambystoma mexicanum]|uniref:zinc finger protein 773-like isoform X2 n=1 Tax=Ambystoma mexicanum TaxID=8296 RepID=UPI0037E7EEB3
MAQEESMKVPVPLPDAVACFSDEEWKLLQEWQKELYKNVMNEIHQALVSLGPLIVTTVSTLRAKEKENVCPVDNRNSGRMYQGNHSSGGVAASSSVSLGIKGEENHYPKAPQEKARRESKECLNTDCYPAVHPDVLLQIQEDDDLNCREWSGSEGFEASNCSRKAGVNNSDNSIEKQATMTWESIFSYSEFGKNTGHISDDMNHHRIQPGGTPNADVGNGFNPKPNSFTHEERHGRQRPTTSSENRRFDESLNMSEQPDLQTTVKVCICSQCGICFNQSTSGHQNQQMNNSEQPNTCSDCITSISVSSNMHSRGKHLAERLHICNQCGKTFKTSQILMRHTRIHTGEKPYVCSECGTSFRHSHTLVTHQRLHTGDKPHTCFTCGKNFRQIPHLMKHQRTHMREKKLDG